MVGVHFGKLHGRSVQFQSPLIFKNDDDDCDALQMDDDDGDVDKAKEREKEREFERRQLDGGKYW